ncbi:MAG: hypothetical protein ACF788_00565, partial [Novipirellula sp. JB048]
MNGIAEDMTYFSCREEGIERLHTAIQEFEDSGAIEKGFCNERTERSGEREPPMTRVLKSSFRSGGPVTADVLALRGSYSYSY